MSAKPIVLTKPLVRFVSEIQQPYGKLMMRLLLKMCIKNRNLNKKGNKMRSYDKYRNTKFIQKGDVEKGALVTIDRITEENVAPEYQATEEIKFVLHFKEDYKPWAPGIEVLETIKIIAGTGNVDKWAGTRLVLFVDPDVKFAGKKVGGVRCRAPKAIQKQPDSHEEGFETQVDDVASPPEDEIPY
jgi:hypothetical protein